jgi:hypothetical protein
MRFAARESMVHVDSTGDPIIRSLVVGEEWS